MKARFFAASAAAVAVFLAFTFARAGDPSPKEEFDKGMKFYEEKSYKKALEHFLKAKQLAPDFEKKDELNFRIATSQLNLRQWIEAEASLKESAKSADHWKLRALMMMGRMYRDWPHEVYAKGEDRRRGEWFEGAEYRGTWQEDLGNVRACFEEAKKVGYELRDLYAAALVAAPKDAKEIGNRDVAVRDLVCELNVDLAMHELGQMQRLAGEQRWKDPAGDAKRYDPSWTPNERVVFLFDEVPGLDPDAKKPVAARAMRDKAAYLLRRPWYFTQKPEDHPVEDALAVLRAAVKDWPESGVAADLQYLIGRILEDNQRFVEAIEEFEKVAANFQDSKWVSDAKYHVQEIRRPRIGLAGASNWLPGEKIELALANRNVGKAVLSLREFDLEAAWKRYAEGGADDFNAGDFANFAVQRMAEKFVGREVSSWTAELGDDGRHAWRSQNVEVPAKKEGAYLLTAAADGLVSSVVVLVSDLVLVERLGSREAFYCVTDAASGQPVEGAEVRVVERVTWWNNNRQVHDTWKTAEKTDRDGMASAKLNGKERGAQVQAFARTGDRIAATMGNYHYSYNEGARSPRVYAYTDRPVYRPGQTVNWKATVRVSNETGYALPASRRVHVELRDPKGNVLVNRDYEANERGSLGDLLKLEEEPPLGVYAINVQADGANGWYQFRVEEYKKPEVLVEVTSKTEQAKLGEGLTAEIAASYYFGGGVPNADVHYTVTRRDFWYWWHRSEEFDWFYGDRWGGGRRRDWGGEVVLDGRGKTDADGKLLIEWSTLKAKQERGDHDHEYTVHAEVTDSSRRTIEGEGQIRVTRTQMFATLNARRGFYTAGDHVEIEMATQNANGQPLGSEGSITVARMTWDGTIQPNGGWKDEPFLTEATKTDSQGRGFWKWQSDREGLYAFIYDTKDAWGEKVQGRVNLRVADPDSDGKQLKFSAVDLTPEDRTYRPGDTARLLLSSEWAGAAVWLTTEANQSLLSGEMIRLAGKNRILEIPLAERHCPNFFVRAVTVREGQVHQSVVELFVPPADKFVDVSMTPSKKEYKPGEKARYDIEAKDWKGLPLVLEFALSVIDKSVLYIAPENVPDVRLFFYGGRRYANVELQTSRNFHSQSHTVDSNKYPEWKLHGNPAGYGGPRGLLRGRHGGAWDAQEKSKTLDALEEAEGGAEPPGADASPAKSGLLREDLKKGDDRGEFAGKKPESPAPRAAADPGEPGGGTAGQPPVVRKNFADTAYWNAFVVTGADGKATVEFDMPDSLTTWRATARGIDAT
ncbi:MAG: hypothetical protein HYY18_19245, partial [Planctomycetes bacterium]|nr:hypothetical protein [Planctomycetota bacterium]